MWTFEEREGNDEWGRSVQRFPTVEGAAEAAKEWLTVCAVNGTFCEVRLVEVVEG